MKADQNVFMVTLTWCALFLASDATTSLESVSNAVPRSLPLESRAAERAATLEYAQVRTSHFLRAAFDQSPLGPRAHLHPLEK